MGGEWLKPTTHHFFVFIQNKNNSLIRTFTNIKENLKDQQREGDGKHVQREREREREN